MTRCPAECPYHIISAAVDRAKLRLVEEFGGAKPTLQRANSVLREEVIAALEEDDTLHSLTLDVQEQ